MAGSGDNATAVCIYAAIATALYRRERTGKGSYVTTSLLAAGVWSASVFVQAALCGASFYGLHDRTHPANAALNTYRSSDGTWFVLVATPDKIPAVLKAMDREDILADPRFSDPAKLAQNRPQLTAMLDGIFGSQPMSVSYTHLPAGLSISAFSVTARQRAERSCCFEKHLTCSPPPMECSRTASPT